MKSEFSEVLIPGGTRVITSGGSGGSSNKWLILIIAMFTLILTSMFVFYELRFAQYERRVSLMEEELDSLLQRYEDEKGYEQYYQTEPEFGNLEDDDDDDEDGNDDDTEELEAFQLSYGEVKLTGETQGRKKRQIPAHHEQIFDPDVPRTQDGVPILDSSYLDKVGVVPAAPSSSYNFLSNTPPPPTPHDNSEGLRLYESLIATGGRGEPKSPDFYPEATARSPILPHHRTSAAWSEKTGARSGLQLKSGDSSSGGSQFSDDVFYTRGSRSQVSSQGANSHRIASSSVSGPAGQGAANGGVTGGASSQFYSSQGTSGSSSNHLSRSGAVGNTVINRASRVPATEDFLYPQNSRARTIQYPPLKRFGQGDGEVVARVLQADNESDSTRPSNRAQAEAHLGETAGAQAESRRSYKGAGNRRGGSEQHNRNPRRHHGHGSAKFQRKETGDAGLDSDEVNIVKAEAWVEGQKAVAAHYVADVSNYTTNHRHYEGNGRLKNADGVFTAWKASEWMVGNLATKAAFSLSSQGILTIRQAGLYYVYAQIHYIDEHDINSFSLNINSTPFLQCTTMTETYNSGSKSNSCFTAGVTYLKENDRVLIRDVEVNRYSIFKPEKSFFGLMKLSGDSGIPKL